MSQVLENPENVSKNTLSGSNLPSTLKGKKNNSLSKEIKNKWAKVYCDSKGSDANVEDYLKTEIKSYKAERYYRDPSVTTSTSDGRN